MLITRAVRPPCPFSYCLTRYQVTLCHRITTRRRRGILSDTVTSIAGQLISPGRVTGRAYLTTYTRSGRPHTATVTLGASWS